MILRDLEKKDAPYMLEWMHDENVTLFLGADFASKTIDDCERFIKASVEDKSENLNLAIADEYDEYMGTVSLKHIDTEEKTAEFAISTRSVSMGKGYAQAAMSEILSKGINELGLCAVYWCVSVENKRAVRFYDKNGYRKTTAVPEKIKASYSKEQLEKFVWYVYE